MRWRERRRAPVNDTAPPCSLSLVSNHGVVRKAILFVKTWGEEKEEKGERGEEREGGKVWRSERERRRGRWIEEEREIECIRREGSICLSISLI